ncbi:MAG TPA: transporter [Magnetospirillum sp.]|nr:transporter [Magnetospirillum sp.]
MKTRLLCLASVFSAVLCSGAHATEGGVSQYPNGAEDFMTGAAPPPGFYLINYAGIYTANRVNDSHGHKLPADVSITAYAEVPRFIWISPHTVFGANWGMHAVIPLVDLDAKVGNWSENQLGLGDIAASPLVLTWHWPNAHLVAALDAIMPTGSYDKSRPANIGTNYWAVEPALAATYLSPEGWEVSAKLMYTVNATNNATDYTSGQAFHTDYTLGKHWGDLAVGIGGYYYQQTTDDMQDGSVVGDGNRGMALAVGPQAKYDFGGKYSVIGKWQHEVMSENRAQGDKFWLKAVVPF